jgi:membrane protein
MIFAVTLLGYTPITSEDVIGLMKQYIPGEIEYLIEDNLRSVLSNGRGGLLSLSAAGAVWSASNALNAIMDALNHAYHVGESRPFWRSKLVALVLTLMMILVIVIALILPVFGKKIGYLIFSILGMSSMFLIVWDFMRWTLSFSIMFAVFVCIYHFAPNKRLKIRDVASGALFTTVGWQLASYGFSYYVNNIGNFTATYGGLGAIIVLMLWFYLIALIIILGGILNATLNALRNGTLGNGTT